jgi:salicylate hydroxylase
VSLTLLSNGERTRETDRNSAGIGFAPNGLRAMDAIEPRFRPMYEKICVGNRRDDARNVFFEGMLLEPGLGKWLLRIDLM